MMNAKIFKEDGSEEFLVSDIKEESGWLVGRLERVSCSGATLALFRRLEDAANQNLIHDAEKAEREIEALDLFVVLDGGEKRRCQNLQLMNGTDVCFKLT